MSGTVRERIRSTLFLFPAGLARLGIVDRKKGEAAFELAAPVMVTGSLRTLLRTADFFMVSLALGPAAVAGLQFGFQYFFIALGLSLAVSSGTISVVSRFHGAEEYDRADLAIKQSLWLALGIALPLTIGGWVYAEPLIDLLTDDAQAIALGAVYLRLIMLSVALRFWSMIAARALQGAGDTQTPMYIRAVSVPTNILLNGVFIFGFGPAPRLGIAGAAVGTIIANSLAAAIFTAVLLSGRYSVQLRVGGSQFDLSIMREIVRVGLPLSGTRLAQALGRFPFLFVLAALGTNVVAAYAIGRRLMMLAMMPAWGYSTASSTLVGQAIGGGDDDEAEAYGWQTVRIALATQLLIAGALFLAARPLAQLFSAENVALTVTFIYVTGVMVAGFSIGRTLRGALRGAGDTSFPFYGTMMGNYLVRLPVAALALPTGMAISILGFSISPGLGLGLPAVFAAIWGDIYTRAAVNWIRFRSDRWKAIGLAGAARAGAGAD
ncbi:MAG: MATE family efflux transporter [Halobacteriales archaeon]|nr:MATE family efflux transporter [Halobacteriales archaeon]